MSISVAPPALTAPPPPPDQPNRRRRWLRRLPVIASALVLLLVGAMAVYVGSVGNNVPRESMLPSLLDAKTRPVPVTNKSTNYVILGSDSRDPDNPRLGKSDVVIVVHLNAQRTQAYLISFPRAMFVAIPGHGNNKINEAYKVGGVTLTVRTLERLLGVRMDHVALADFVGFIDLTTDLGGVTVVNKRASSYGGFDFPKGKVTVSGEKALAYVRERKDLPGDDLDRAARQRDVLRAVLVKGMSKDTMSDPIKFARFVNGVTDHVTVDETLTSKEIRKLGLSLRMTGKDVQQIQAPLSGHAFTADKVAIQLVDPLKLADLQNAFRDDQMQRYVEKYPHN